MQSETIEELSDSQINILGILWLYGPLCVTPLRELLVRGVFELTPDYLSSIAALRVQLEELSRRQLAFCGDSPKPNMWTFAGNVGFETLRALALRLEKLPLLDFLRKEYPAVRTKNLYRSSEDLVIAREREMTLSILTGNRKDYAKILDLWHKDYYYNDSALLRSEDAVWKRLLTSLQECPETLADCFLPEALDRILLQKFIWSSSAASWEERLRRLPSNVFNDRWGSFANVATYALWRGDRPLLTELEKFASFDGAPDYLAGCHAFLDGDWITAEKKFQHALSAYREVLGYRNALWQDFAGMAHIFAAIRNAASQTKVAKLVAYGGSNWEWCDWRQGRLIPQFQGYLDRMVNRNMPGDPTWFHALGKPQLPTALLLSQWLIHFDRKHIPPDIGPSLLEGARKAAASGYRLAAIYLYSGVMTVLDLPPEDEKYLRQAMDEYRLAPLWMPRRKDELWQLALDELTKIAPKPTAAKNAAGPAAMVGWHVTLIEDKGLYRAENIEPRLHKRRADGSWSVGRTMALTKLRSGEYDEHLLPEDLAMKAGIKIDTGWRGDQHYLPSETLAGLVGNTRVFEISGNNPQPIRIVPGECCLQAEKASGGYRISLPFSRKTLGNGVVMRREAPDTYKLFRFDENIRKIAELLSRYGNEKEQLLIPAQGEKAFQTAMTRLSGAIRVVGTIEVSGVEGVTQIDGKVELHMRLTPSGAGIAMELLNRPVPQLGYMVIPGAGAPQTLVDSGKEKLAVTRNLKLEKSRVKELLAACPALSGWETSVNRWEIDDLASALTVLGELHDAAAPVTLEWPQGKGYEVTRRIDFGDMEFSLGFSASEWLTIGGRVKVDEQEVAHLALILQKLPDAIGDFIPLDERKYLRLTSKMRRQLEELSGALQGKGDTLTAPAGALPLLLEALPEKVQAGFGQVWRERADAFRRALEITPAVPKGLQGELRPYQQDGFVWLSRLYEWGVGACLADDMGLGKTVQILALLLNRAAAGPSLVIAPASVCRNWQREAARFAPGLNVRLLGNTDRAEGIGGLTKYDVLVCSYGLLVSEEELLAGKNWNCVVLDEAQAIKNHQSKRAHAAKKLKAKFRLSATGTPLENHLDELWSLFDFINPKLLGTYAHFTHKFMSSAAPAHVLKKLVGPFILRRLKTQVLDELPPKTEITLEVTLSNQERNLYETLRREALQSLSEDSAGTHIGILAQLTRLRRACCHPTLVAPKTPMAGAKMELLADLVNELRDGGHRALIFSQFVDFLSLVRHHFDAEKIAYQYLDGSTPVEDRMTRVDAFQHGEGDFFLISLKAGGTGLNLTAANYVILLDPWWNPAVENQAADRAHRIGQNQPVTVYRLITADTVEERVIELHARKREMAEEILDGAEKTRLSKDELMMLFQ